MRASRSCGSGAQCAVMKSVVCTARSATAFSYVRPSPITPTERTGRNTANACAVLSYHGLPSASCAIRSSSMKIASARRSRSARSRVTSPRMRTPSPGPGNGWRNTMSRGRPSSSAQLAHLVLEEFAQRLEQLQMQRLRQAADVVVRLDRVRLLGLGAGGLDDVRIDRALRQPLRVGELRGLALEHLDEQPPDDLALLLRIRDARERAPGTRRWRRRG